MQVKDWMSSDVVVVEETTSIIKIIKIFRDKDIRHIPVMKKDRLVGMIMDQDIKEVSPSQATAMSAQDLYFLLSEMTAKDVMRPDPVTIGPDQTMEMAAFKMLEYKVTGLPVVGIHGDLEGIVSQGDVFKVLISITGIYQGGVQFIFNLEDRSGSIKEVADVIREENGQIVSILSTSQTADEGYRHVFLRIKKMPDDRLQNLTKKLQKHFLLLRVVKDPLTDIS